MKVYVITQGQPGELGIVGVVTDKIMIPPGVLEQRHTEVVEVDLDALPDLKEGESLWEVFYKEEGPSDGMKINLTQYENNEEWDNGDTHYRIVIANSEEEAIEFAKERYEREGNINA